MSFSNYFENVIGKGLLGIEPVSSITTALGSNGLYMALITSASAAYSMGPGPSNGPESMDPTIEKLATILDASTELQDSAYERQPIAFMPYSQYFSDPNTPEVIPGRFTNTADILFPAATVEWNVTHFAITTSTKADQADQMTDFEDMADDGRVLMWGSFSLQYDPQTYQPIPLVVPIGDQLKVPAGSLSIYF